MTVQTVDVDELSKQRIGYISMSLTDWTATTVSQYSAGSCVEIAGSLYYVTADENMGTAGEWAGIANSTLVYSYYNVATDLYYYSSSAPTWDDAKQGWYHAVSTTHRCMASIYKDSVGAYTQKTIFANREQGITYQGICLISQTSNELHSSILWDGSENIFNKSIDCNYKIALGGAGIELATYTGSGNGAGFYIKKPIAVYVYSSATAQNLHGDLQICQNSEWTTILSAEYYGTSNHYDYGAFILPGYYRLAAFAGSQTVKLYCTGIYGANDIVVAEIIA